MNNEIYLRLEGLMKKLGLSVESGSFTKAEMMAYAAAVNLAEDKMKDTLKNIFIDTAGKTGTALFLSMVGEKPAASAEDSKNRVIDAVSDNIGIYTRSQFNSLVAGLGDTEESTTYTVSGNVMKLNYGGTANRPRFEDFSKQVNKHNPCTVVIDSGNGRTFGTWNSSLFKWFELDSLSIPFVTIDGM